MLPNSTTRASTDACEKDSENDRVRFADVSIFETQDFISQCNQLVSEDDKLTVFYRLAMDRYAGDIYYELNGLCLKTFQFSDVRFLFIDQRDNGSLVMVGVAKNPDGKPPCPTNRDKKFLEKIFNLIFLSAVGVATKELIKKIIDTFNAADVSNIYFLRTKEKEVKSYFYAEVGILVLKKLFLITAGFEKKQYQTESVIKSSSRKGFEMPRISSVAEKFAHSLVDVKLHCSGQRPLKETRIPIPAVNVKSIRSELGLSQKQFAEQFGLSLSTVRNWEQGTREPEQPIAILLHLIRKFPEQVASEVTRLRVVK